MYCYNEILLWMNLIFYRRENTIKLYKTSDVETWGQRRHLHDGTSSQLKVVGSRTDKHTTTKSPLRRKRGREHKNSALDIRYRAVLGVGMGGGSGMTTDREGMKGPNRIHSRLDQCQRSLYAVSKMSERKHLMISKNHKVLLACNTAGNF